MTQRFSNNSWVERVVTADSGHCQGKSMYLRLKPAKDGGCPWRTSEENHWVADLASHLLDYARSFRNKLQFHQFFEKPSHTSESKKQAGYDLSCGPYDNESFRIRTMHKVIKGKWCDAYWKWTADKDDLRHIHALLSQPDYANYLVINVFYCLHDWRRAGLKVINPGDVTNEFVIPSLKSSLRTVIVDISSSQALLGSADVKVVVTCAGLRDPVKSVKEWENATGQPGFITATADGTPLKTVTVSDLYEKVKKAWSTKKKWAGSRLV